MAIAHRLPQTKRQGRTRQTKRPTILVSLFNWFAAENAIKFTQTVSKPTMLSAFLLTTWENYLSTKTLPKHIILEY